MYVIIFNGIEKKLKYDLVSSFKSRDKIALVEWMILQTFLVALVYQPNRTVTVANRRRGKVIVN